jgi:hypothetical protein
MMKPKRTVSVRGLQVHVDKLRFGTNFPWESLLGFSRETIEELDWRELTNKAPFTFIRKHRNALPWDWEALSLSRNIRWEYLIIHNMPWVYRVLHRRDDFSLEFYSNNVQNYPWNHEAISSMSDFPLSLAARFPKIRWSWESICRREAYTFDFANAHSLPMLIKASGRRFKSEYLDLYPNIQWDFCEIAKVTNKGFYLETRNDPRWTRETLSFVRWDVFDLIDDGLGWNFQRLSKNLHLRANHLRMPGDWNLVLASRTVPLEDIFDNPSIEWNYDTVGSRSDISCEIIEQHSELPWPWDGFERNYWFSYKLVCALPDKPWNFQSIVDRLEPEAVNNFVNRLGEYLSNVSLQYVTQHASVSTIKKNPRLNWDWRYISRSLPISSSDLVDLPNLINELLVENPFYVDIGEEILESMSDL